MVLSEDSKKAPSDLLDATALRNVKVAPLRTGTYDTFSGAVIALLGCYTPPPPLPIELRLREVKPDWIWEQADEDEEWSWPSADSGMSADGADLTIPVSERNYNDG